MNSIIYDDKIITPKKYKHQYYYNFFKKLEQRDCVKCTLFCAKMVNPNTKKTNHCIELVEKWLVDEKSISIEELDDAAYDASAAAAYAAYAIDYTVNAADAATNAFVYCINTVDAVDAVYDAYYADANIDIVNKYLQVLLRETKQFQNNKILEQISKVDVDKLELVDWNMITDIMLEEYNIGHGFEYKDIFSRRCLIELLRREYL